jgi:hypothetical protein
MYIRASFHPWIRTLNSYIGGVGSFCLYIAANDIPTLIIGLVVLSHYLITLLTHAQLPSHTTRYGHLLQDQAFFQYGFLPDGDTGRSLCGFDRTDMNPDHPMSHPSHTTKGGPPNFTGMCLQRQKRLFASDFVGLFQITYGIARVSCKPGLLCGVMRVDVFAAC